MEQFLKKIQTEYIITIFIFIGLIIFGRIFFNGFVGDDLGYITHPYIQQTKLIELFQSGSADLGGDSPITSQFFRPLMLVAISLLYAIFSDHAFFYHLFQLLFHIANVILLFFLFRKMFSHYISALLSLIYLVHPINVETVAYISDIQDVLFVFFGLAGITTLLYYPSQNTEKIALPLLLFLSLLSKETGIVFFFVIFFYVWLYQKSRFISILLPLLIAGVLYGIIRFFIAGVGVGNAHNAVFGHVSLQERLIHIPSIFLYYIQTVLFPKDLAIAQTWSIQPNVLTVGIPFSILFTIVAGILIFYFYLKKKCKKESVVFLFFMIWVLSGMLLHIQIIPLEMTVADRWFYFPFVGLLGMIGVVYSLLKKEYKIVFITISLIAILLLSLRTVIRLGDWKDAITLYSHDSRLTKSYLLEHSLGYEYLQQNNLPIAFIHLQKAVDIFPTSQNTNSLGVYYYKTGNIKEAEKLFTKSIKLGDNFLAYNNLSRIYVSEKSNDKAKKIITLATQKFPKSDAFWYLLAITEYQMGNKQTALTAAEKAFILSPNQQNEYVYYQLRNNLPIKIND